MTSTVRVLHTVAWLLMTSWLALAIGCPGEAPPAGQDGGRVDASRADRGVVDTTALDADLVDGSAADRSPADLFSTDHAGADGGGGADGSAGADSGSGNDSGTASDAGGGDRDASTGDSAPGNMAPVFGALDPVVLAENQSVDLILTATDADGDPLSFALVSAPGFASLAGATLTLAPGYSDAGAYTVVVRVSDGLAMVQGALSVQVTDVNRPPTMVALSDLAMVAGTQQVVTLVATDPDGDQVGFALVAPAPGWASIAGSALTLAPGPGVVGTSTLTVEATDDGAAPLSVRRAFDVTVTAPTTVHVTLTINGAAAFAQSDSVSLGIQASSSTGALTQMRFSNDGVDWSTLEAYATTRDGWLLAADPAEGMKTVQVEVLDDTGASGFGSASIVVDATPPVIARFVLDGGAVATASAQVLLVHEVSDALSGVALIEASNDGVSYSAVHSPAWTLDDADGLRTVHLRVTDQAGNAASASDDIFLDRVPPTLVTAAIAGGASWVSSTAVHVGVSSTADPAPSSGLALICATGPGVVAACQPHAAGTASFSLRPGEGAKYLDVYLRDAAGNASNLLPLAVNLDTTPPTLDSFAINDGASLTASATVSATSAVSSTPAPIASLELSNDGGASWTALAWQSPQAWTLSAGDGDKTVTARVRDAAGNASTPPYPTASIHLDSTAPLFTLDVAGGQRATHEATVPLDILTDDDPADLEMFVAVAPASQAAPAIGSYLPFAATVDVDISASGERDLRLWVSLRDRAGNVSAYQAYVIAYDITAPQVSAVAPVDGATGVALFPPITVTFSEAMDADTLATAIAVSGATGHWQYDDASRTATYVLDAALAPDTTVEVQLGAVTDIAGNPLAAPYHFSFTSGPYVVISGPSAPELDDTLSASGAGGSMLVWSVTTGLGARLHWAHFDGASWRDGQLGEGHLNDARLLAWGERFVLKLASSWKFFEQGAWVTPAAPAPAGNIAANDHYLAEAGRTGTTIPYTARVRLFDGQSWGSWTNLQSSVVNSNPAIVASDTGFAVAFYHVIVSYTPRVAVFNGTSWSAAQDVTGSSSTTFGIYLASNGHGFAVASAAGAPASPSSTVKVYRDGVWSSASFSGSPSQLVSNGVGYAFKHFYPSVYPVRIHDGSAWLPGSLSVSGTIHGGAGLYLFSSSQATANGDAHVLRVWDGSALQDAWTAPDDTLDSSFNPRPTPLFAAGAIYLPSVSPTGELSALRWNAGSWSAETGLASTPAQGLVYALQSPAGRALTWASGAIVRARTIDAGWTHGAETEVARSTLSGIAYAPQVAFTPAGLGLAVWTQRDAGVDGTYAAAFDGASWQPAFQVLPECQYPRVASNGASFAITCLRYSSEEQWATIFTPGSGLDVPMVLGAELSPANAYAATPELASDGAGYLAAWLFRPTSSGNVGVRYSEYTGSGPWSAALELEPAGGTSSFSGIELAGSSMGYAIAYRDSSRRYVRVYAGSMGAAQNFSGTSSYAIAANPDTFAFAASNGSGSIASYIYDPVGETWGSATSSSGYGMELLGSASGFCMTSGTRVMVYAADAWGSMQTVTGLSLSALASDGSEYLGVGTATDSGVTSLQRAQTVSGVMQAPGFVESIAEAVADPAVGHAGAGGYWGLWSQTLSAQGTRVIYGRSGL